MSRRAVPATMLSVALLASGCAVGRFIAGAPSSRSTASQQALLMRRCTGCHEAPDPARMSDAEWRASLERMKRRLRLPASEWDSLAAMGRGDSAR